MMQKECPFRRFGLIKMYKMYSICLGGEMSHKGKGTPFKNLRRCFNVTIQDLLPSSRLRAYPWNHA